MRYVADDAGPVEANQFESQSAARGRRRLITLLDNEAQPLRFQFTQRFGEGVRFFGRYGHQKHAGELAGKARHARVEPIAAACGYGL